MKSIRDLILGLLTLLFAAGGAAFAAPGEPVDVPDFLKPGTRLLYDEGGGTADTRSAEVSGGVGMVAYDVIAVTGGKVLLQKVVFPARQDNRGFEYGTNVPAEIDLTDFFAVQELWYPPADLAKLQSGGGVTVSRATIKVNGHDRETVAVSARDSRNVVASTYDAETGLLLLRAVENQSEYTSTTQPTTQQRKKPETHSLSSSSTRRFVQLRQRPLPWLKTPAPDWLPNLRQLRYAGTVNDPSLTQPIELSSDVALADRGDDWATLTLETFLHAPVPGRPRTKVAVPGWNVGPGIEYGIWISPAALGNMAPGVVDQDKVLGTTLRYEIKEGPLGRLALLRLEDSDGQTIRVHGFDPQTGLMVYQRLFTPSISRTLEVRLVGQE